MKEILTGDEIDVVRKIFQKYRRFKVEYEDLLQEARMAKWEGKNIERALTEYCEKWKRDPLSSAFRKDDFP